MGYVVLTTDRLCVLFGPYGQGSAELSANCDYALSGRAFEGKSP